MPETTFRPAVTGLDDRSAPSSLASWSWTYTWSWTGQPAAVAPTPQPASPPAAPVYAPPVAAIPPAPVAAPAPVVALPATPELNSQVLGYAQSHLGQSVDQGNGANCYALAASALQSAGAAPQWQLGTTGPISNHYTWGTTVYQASQTGGYGNVGSLSDVRPGDIVQLDSYHQVSAGGYWSDAPHHTAVVSSVDAAGGKINVLQQNWNGQQSVTAGSFSVGDMTSGVVSVYRPHA